MVDASRRLPEWGDTVSPSALAQSSPQYDAARRRRSLRKQRERGCSVYIPADVLEAAGFAPNEPPPFYRVWGSRRGSVLVRLYRAG
jgi:hypothetical protein